MTRVLSDCETSTTRDKTSADAAAASTSIASKGLHAVVSPFDENQDYRNFLIIAVPKIN